MRVDKLELRNFKKFAEQTFEFHPHFTLLVGENGSGKTSVLDALAVALGVWFVEPPDSTLAGSRRPILGSEIRLEAIRQGDRTVFQEPGPAVVKAHGRIDGLEGVVWTRQTNPRQGMNNSAARDAIRIIQHAYARAKANEFVLLPVIAYYGAGRAWLPYANRIKEMDKPSSPARRWAAFYKCLRQRLRFKDLREWFKGETIAFANRGGRFRPGFEVVRRAVLRCVPGADALWYDHDEKQIVLSIGGQAQPIRNLSAGQRMMLALVADIAIKAVSLNNFLVPPETLTADDEPLPRVLKETPGVVLIDELEAHLHPRWQRRVAEDLKSTFPEIQFVCASHSPQVIGEVPPAEILLLDGNITQQPGQSFGMDSNWILRELMGAEEQDAEIKAELRGISDLIAARKIDLALEKIGGLRNRVGNSESIQRAESTIERMRLLGK